MSSYIVSYDLSKPGQDYTKLYDAIKAYSWWWHYLDSTWVIVTDDSAVSIRDNLYTHMDSNDELLVAKLTGTAAWNGFEAKASDWLKEHL